MGMVVLASDVPVYQGSLADGPAGQLVANDHRTWYATLDWLVRDQAVRRSMAGNARDAFLTHASLASDPAPRREAWTRLLLGRMLEPASDLRHVEPGLTISHEQSDLVTRKRRHSGRGR
jgi:hypothetical protein